MIKLFLEELETELVRGRLESELLEGKEASYKQKVLKSMEEKVNELEEKGELSFIEREEISIFIEKHFG